MTKTILVLAANPGDTPLLRLDQEVREICNGLERARKRDEFVLQQKLAARPVDVRRAMLDYKPNIVHFCGHGSGKEGIAFEDENGQSKLVSTDALAGFFELFADKVESVVLNACYSEVQAKAIAKHIPYVIGMRKAIGDAAAIEFAVAFYDGLGAGESIEFAYKLGCNAIQWANLPDNLTPVLKKRLIKRAKSKKQPEIQTKNPSESEQTLLDDRREFAEVLQHRAQILLDYIEKQKQSTIEGDYNNRARHEKRYESIKEQFAGLHKSYIESIQSGKTQFAHELLGDIYRLLYEVQDPVRERWPVYYEESED
jgi:hypothetical protein